MWFDFSWARDLGLFLALAGLFSPETHLLEMLDTELFNSAFPTSWEGTAAELERKLTADNSTVKREARNLLTFQAACGTYLGRLRNLYPDRFEDKHTKKGNRWTIHPSQNGDEYGRFRLHPCLHLSPILGPKLA